MRYTFIQWILVFFVYCVAGWIWETLFALVRKRKFVNRGFLHGPWLPIYGSGSVVILLCVRPVRDNLWLVFIMGMIGATVLEYITGIIMEQLFNVRYWDYSNMKLNIKGHICVLASLLWGFFSVVVSRFVHPEVEKIIALLSYNAAEILAVFLTVVFVVDVTISVGKALHLKKILIELAKNKSRLGIDMAEHIKSDFKYVASIIRRNPSAVSKKYKEIFAQLKEDIELKKFF